MRLSDFIVRNMEPILVQWEAFAATLLPAARHMTSHGLRDHAREILIAVAKDIATPQTREAQHEKSLGRAPEPANASETAAQTHAVLRAQRGFNINQLAAEYRALRASVLRLWIDACRPGPVDMDDMIRFNEAIDQALAESVSFFTEQVEQARNLFLGMLSHDMRTPLQTIQLTASYLAALNAGEEISEAAARLIRSGGRMQGLLDDLCDFNRTQLGLGINVVPRPIDLAHVLVNVVDELRAGHPDREITVDMRGDLRGEWDDQRMQQLLSNLVSNAVKYGARDTPVRVVAATTGADVVVEVGNSGPAIDPRTLDRIFDPLERGEADRSRRTGDDAGLGLGLFIANEIAKAHRGRIDARSDQTETVFTVRLPRGI
ncbi:MULTISPECIES: sensor histidine kinase [Burkholderia]|uniref:sensor histidine kinase n=1 Tax=Burkholderia TaxID=32008 RepID=UPI0006798024|nr:MULTISPECIES: sensor histidine kinase [Burkholderia]KWU27915.1 histidine kinase [Burkholderia cenocepacia]OXI68386.1 two-component sensor histidine kinase [Burkholderia sp. AU31280]